MKHTLNLRAAVLYGRLIDGFVATYRRPDFEKAFDEFLDAYDNPKPKIRLPEVGKYYHSETGNVYNVLAVTDDGENCFVTLKSLRTTSDGRYSEFAMCLLPSDVERLKLKECSNWLG